MNGLFRRPLFMGFGPNRLHPGLETPLTEVRGRRPGKLRAAVREQAPRLPGVSRQHCRFSWEQGGWQVIDLKSLNGIRVNGEIVLRSALHEGDELRIGGFTFRI